MPTNIKPTKPGWLYVLSHPSDSSLFKIGVTVLRPEVRLAQHNSQYEKAAGRVVAATGQRWTIRATVAVVDPYWAERAFWGATPLADIPFLGGIEIASMEWAAVERGLAAAENAGTRPMREPRSVRNGNWMLTQLEGTSIAMVDRYAGLVRSMNFQCSSGHVFRESAGLLAKKKSCPCCTDWGFTRGHRAGIRRSLG